MLSGSLPSAPELSSESQHIVDCPGSLSALSLEVFQTQQGAVCIENNSIPTVHHRISHRCNVDSKVSRVAWLNRTIILFAGSEKWSLDPRVILMENTAVTEYSIMIQNVDVHDEGALRLLHPYKQETKIHKGACHRS
ncbi:hypothetical protein KUCAC02_003874, partial [Chaenocephalus aceratus]